MKTVVILFLVAATLSGSRTAELNDGAVQQELQAYAFQRYARLPMVRGGNSMVQCYNKYLPEIAKVAESGQAESEACATRADARKADELSKVQAERNSLDQQVKTVQETLGNCVDNTDALDYLKCLKDNGATAQATINAIAGTSGLLYDQLNKAYESVNTAQDTCITSVMDKSRQDTDALFEALQRCMMTGLIDPEPEQPANPGEDSGENPDGSTGENPDGNTGGNPENPDENPGENPENPDENPSNPDENPSNPDENPENPDENPENPDENPESPDENPENPDANPDSAAKPDDDLLPDADI